MVSLYGTPEAPEAETRLSGNNTIVPDLRRGPEVAFWEVRRLRWYSLPIVGKWRQSSADPRTTPESVPRNALGVIEPFNLRVVATRKLTWFPSIHLCNSQVDTKRAFRKLEFQQFAEVFSCVRGYPYFRETDSLIRP